MSFLIVYTNIRKYTSDFVFKLQYALPFDFWTTNVLLFSIEACNMTIHVVFSISVGETRTMRDSQILSTSTSIPSWKILLKTSRPFSLTAAVSPVLVGSAIAAYQGTFHILTFFLTLFSCLFLQIGTNYFNEYFDYRYGLDHAGSLGASTVIFRKEMTAAQVLSGAIVCFALAALLGIALIFIV